MHEQGYMAVFICAIVVAQQCNIQLAGKLHVCQMFVKADGVVHINFRAQYGNCGWVAKVLGTGLLCLFFTYYAMLQCSKF